MLMLMLTWSISPDRDSTYGLIELYASSANLQSSFSGVSTLRGFRRGPTRHHLLAAWKVGRPADQPRGRKGAVAASEGAATFFRPRVAGHPRGGNKTKNTG